MNFAILFFFFKIILSILGPLPFHLNFKTHVFCSRNLLFIFMANRWGISGNCQTLFWGAPKSLQMVTKAMK